MQARAESWWGDGYRPPEWVVTHGGTVVWYEITGREAAAERYGALMEQNGKFVEDEEGPRMKFDDPKNGLYKVTALLGKKRLLSVDVFAHPGETIHITFDLKNKKTTVISNQRRTAPIERTPVAPQQHTINKKTGKIPAKNIPSKEILAAPPGDNMTRANMPLVDYLSPIKNVFLNPSSRKSKTVSLGAQDGI